MEAEAEYVSLRQEMLQSESHIVTVTAFVMTATGAALVAAFSYKNPIAALFPLFVLHLGDVVVFNNVQTIALIGSYLQIFWEGEHPEYRWETRQTSRRSIAVAMLTRSKRANTVERWMGPLAQVMFYWTGWLCTFIGGYIAYQPIARALVHSWRPSDFTRIPVPHLDGVVDLVLMLLAIGLWFLKWRHGRSIADPVHGETSMMGQCREMWQRVKAAEQSPGPRQTGPRPAPRLRRGRSFWGLCP